MLLCVEEYFHCIADIYHGPHVSYSQLRSAFSILAVVSLGPLVALAWRASCWGSDYCLLSLIRDRYRLPMLCGGRADRILPWKPLHL